MTLLEKLFLLIELVYILDIKKTGKVQVSTRRVEDAVLEAWEDKPTLLAFVPVDR